MKKKALFGKENLEKEKRIKDTIRRKNIKEKEANHPQQKNQPKGEVKKETEVKNQIVMTAKKRDKKHTREPAERNVKIQF